MKSTSEQLTISLPEQLIARSTRSTHAGEIALSNSDVELEQVAPAEVDDHIVLGYN